MSKRTWPEKVQGFFPEDTEIPAKPVGSELADYGLNFGSVRFESVQQQSTESEESESEEQQ